MSASDIAATWTEAAAYDKYLKTGRKHLPALAAKRVHSSAYSRNALFAALYAGTPILFSDFHVPLSGSEGLAKLIVNGFDAAERARVQVGPRRERMTLPVKEVIRRWEGRRAVVSVTDLHVRGQAIEAQLGIGPLSDFNLLLCGSEGIAEQEMMTMVISTRGNVTDSHSDDPDGSNHCFSGRKLWLAWDTFEGKAAGLEDNSRDKCDGDAAFDLDAFLSLETSRWWTVAAGETLFLPGHLTHRVITLEHYIGIGSFFVALPSAIQTLARWNEHGPLWSLGGAPEKAGLVDEITAVTARTVEQLAQATPEEQEHWGLSWICRAAIERDTKQVTSASFQELVRRCAQLAPLQSSWQHREPPVYIGETAGRGRGVFADQDLRKGDRYEGLVWLLPRKAVPMLETMVDRRSGEPLSEYTCDWSPQMTALPQGWAGMLNHSETPNLEYTGNDRRRKTLVFTTLRDIRRGEELTFRYREGTVF